MIKWSNKINLDNKLNHPYSITTIKKKIEYINFKVISYEGRNRQFKRKVILLGYKVLELRIFSLREISIGIFKAGDLKVFNKFVF